MKKSIFASIAVLALVPTMAVAQPGQQTYQQGRPQSHQSQQQNHPQRYEQNQRGPQRAQHRQEARWDYNNEVRSYNRQNPWRAAPFKYQRFRAGAAIRPAYYNNRYTINDYGRFRWSAPRANQKWVRHYDDALLVNTRTGRIIEVKQNAFRNR